MYCLIDFHFRCLLINPTRSPIDMYISAWRVYFCQLSAIIREGLFQMKAMNPYESIVHFIPSSSILLQFLLFFQSLSAVQLSSIYFSFFSLVQLNVRAFALHPSPLLLHLIIALVNILRTRCECERSKHTIYIDVYIYIQLKRKNVLM